MHACRNVESILAERGEDVKQLTQDTIEFTPEDLIGQTKMKEIANQFSSRQDETKGIVGTHGSLYVCTMRSDATTCIYKNIS